MKNKKVARRYNLALYDIAVETKVSEAVIKDFEDIAKTLNGSKELVNFLETPVISSAKKSEVVKALFKGKINELTLKYLELIAEKSRISDLRTFITDYLALVNEKTGIVTATVRTAVAVTDKEKSAINNRLKKYIGKEIKAEYSVDPSIKGGFIARIEDKVVDASIKRQLELLREKFAAGSFNN